MASQNTATLATKAGQIPARGTIPAAANQYFPLNTIVQIDANGRAVSPGTADASGLPMFGVSKASYDNRTGSYFGGANDAFDVDVDFGVVAYQVVGTVPKPRDKLYVVDNVTVSASSNGGTRGFAGICTEVQVRNGITFAYFWCGPHVVGLFRDVANAPVDLPIFSSLVGGAPLAAFINGASPTPGLELTDSESGSVRWNNNATLTPIFMTVRVPKPQDPAAPRKLHLLCSKVGNTLADATTFTVTAFAVAAGDLHDADANFGGVTGAVAPTAASKTMQEVTLDLAGVDVPDTEYVLTISIQPTNGTLGTDDMCLHAAWIT